MVSDLLKVCTYDSILFLVLAQMVHLLIYKKKLSKNIFIGHKRTTKQILLITSWIQLGNLLN